MGHAAMPNQPPDVAPGRRTSASTTRPAATTFQGRRPHHPTAAHATATRPHEKPRLEREVAAWEAARNATGRGVDWRLTTEDARIKLKHLYPVIQG
jgi:hypothetical protein